MKISKSMISVAAAAVLMTGFTGCSSDTNNVSTTSGQSHEINNPKGTVTGMVMDTNGNGIGNVTVSVAGQTTTTEESGAYIFYDVPVVNTDSVSATADTGNGFLQVIVSAPEGYLGATVTVYPEAQQLNSGDNQNQGNHAQTNPNTNFIDGYIATAGTAVLPELSATVKGRLEMDGTEASVANTTITLDFLTTANMPEGNRVNPTTIAELQNTVSTTYSTRSYSAVTDADGKFEISNVPADSILRYVVSGYNVAPGEERPQAQSLLNNFLNRITVETRLETGSVDVGDIQLTKIITEDSQSPYVTVVTENTPAANVLNTVFGDRLMLEDDVTASRTFIINFSESIERLSEDDTDVTESITVYSYTQGKYLTATAKVMSGNQLEITMSEDLLDAEVFDVNLLITDFKDDAGNHLDIEVDNTNIDQNGAVVNGADGVDDNRLYVNKNAGNGQAVRIQLMAYTNLNLNADPVTDEAQMKKDILGVAQDGLDDYRAFSNAFNDVNLPKAAIQQLNAPEAWAKLNILGVYQWVAQDPLNRSIFDANAPTVVDSVNVARITFTPSNASAYLITINKPNGQSVNNFTIDGTMGANSNATYTVTAVGVVPKVYTVTAGNNAEDVELVLNNVNIDDIVTITPLDDYGYTGTPQTIALVDNVAPTTKTQQSYMTLFGNAGINSGTTWAPFGDGGELTNPFGNKAPLGTPILGVSPGLLDNLDANGNNILENNEFTTGDETLDKELLAHNGVNPLVDPTKPVITESRVYDATAWAVFSGDLERKIGVAFTEDVNLTGAAAPTYTGATIDMNSFTVVNDVLVNDSGSFLDLGFPGLADVVDNDLVAFTTSNVIALANENHGEVLSFDGIKDANGNIASNADVVLQDRMPAFVEKSYYDGDLVLEFNEPLAVPGNDTWFPYNTYTNMDDEYIIGIRNVGNSDRTIIRVRADNETAGLTTNWELSADGKTLTIYSSHPDMQQTMNGNGIHTLFIAGTEYIEPIYDNELRRHAVVTFGSPRDRHTYVDSLSGEKMQNSWWSWALAERNNPAEMDLRTPRFAAIDMIGEFIVEELSSKFNIGEDANLETQEIVWHFSHPIEVDTDHTVNPGIVFFDSDTTGMAYDSATGIFTANTDAIANTWDGVPPGNSYQHVLAGASFNGDFGDQGGTADSTDNAGSTFMRLSADRKDVTFTFKTQGSAVIQSNDNVGFFGTAGEDSAFRSALTGDEKTAITATPTQP